MKVCLLSRRCGHCTAECATVPLQIFPEGGRPPSHLGMHPQPTTLLCEYILQAGSRVLMPQMLTPGNEFHDHRMNAGITLVLYMHVAGAAGQTYAQAPRSKCTVGMFAGG